MSLKTSLFLIGFFGIKLTTYFSQNIKCHTGMMPIANSPIQHTQGNLWRWSTLPSTKRQSLHWHMTSRKLDNTSESGEGKAPMLFPDIHSPGKPYPEGKSLCCGVGGVPHMNKGPLCKHQPEILPLQLALVPPVPST